MRINLILLLAFLTINQEAKLQTNQVKIKNHYTFYLVGGLNANDTKAITGTNTPENATGIAPGLNFQYSRMLRDKFSIGLGFGFGVLPINIKVKADENFIPNEQLNSDDYYSSSFRKGFTRYDLSAAYHHKLSDKLSLKLSLGGGLIHYGGFSFGSYGDVGLPNNQAVQLYAINGNFNNAGKPYLSGGVELSRSLKNNDLVSLKLNYEHAFRNAYTATYSLYNATSTGEFFNRGSFLNLQLGYTITASKRLNEVQRLQTEQSMTRKEAKKATKKSMRYIDPKSSFIHLATGIGVGVTKIGNDPNGVILKSGFPSFLPRIAFEKGIKNNFYWEVGLHGLQFWNVSKFSYSPYSSFGTNTFYAIQLSGGGIYRWILKNNYNVANFHAGLTTGYHGSRNNAEGLFGIGGGSTEYMDGNEQMQYFIYNYESKIVSPVLFSAYLGISKDFRIVNNFYLSLNYRQQIGLKTVFESHYNYNGSVIPATTHAITKLNGSSRDFQIGFKLKLPNKRND
jgi:hypothetical protein